MRLPWRKWFAADWLAEVKMADCPAGGRGLWAEALQVMIASETYQLSGTPAQLSRTLRFDEDDFCRAFAELAPSGVADTAVEPFVTVTAGSNAIVTIKSRRLEREIKARESNRLRQQKSRLSRVVSHTNPSASGTLISDLSGKEGVKGEEKPPAIESPAVELPKGFPTCVEDAIDQGLTVLCPPEFKEAVWLQARSRSGFDSRGQPIHSWPHHLAAQWKWEQNRRQEQAAKGVNGQSRGAFPPSLRDQLKATEALIDKHVANPRRDDRTRVPTEEEREHFKDLKRKLTNLQRQIAGDV